MEGKTDAAHQPLILRLLHFFNQAEPLYHLFKGVPVEGMEQVIIDVIGTQLLELLGQNAVKILFCCNRKDR